MADHDFNSIPGSGLFLLHLEEFPDVINLGDLDGHRGLRLFSAGEDFGTGASVSGAGDVNDDGFDDLIIGASLAIVDEIDSGAAYVLFGQAGGFDTSIDLSTLDGSNGFRLSGGGSGDRVGISVSGAGDINGDGIDDVVVGANRHDSIGPNAGASYVVFGQSAGFTANIDLTTLDGNNGFRLDGLSLGDFFGGSVSGAGDVNGDGIDDLLIGANIADANGIGSGSSYVIFGQAGGFAASMDMSMLDGSNGFRLDGIAQGDSLGRSVSGAGDVNGDGFADIVVGADGADPNGEKSGSSYVIFGKAQSFGANLDLSTLTGEQGFRLDGAAKEDSSGRAVSSAGDINGDGYTDLIIGAGLADPNGSFSGSSYVVFGKASGFPARINLGSLNSTDGFRFDGVAASDLSGLAVSGAGDVNGDGFDDLIVGARGADPNGSSSGSSYVFFGKAAGYVASVDLSALNGNNGFRLDGVDEGDLSGFSVSGAGDFNGDGFDDLVIGAFGADQFGFDSASAYLVYGTISGSEETNNKPTGEVRISGDAIEGQVLSATEKLADIDGLGFVSYQWRADGLPVAGATSNTFKLTDDQVGTVVSVTASFIDGLGNSESVTQELSDRIEDSPFVSLAELNGTNGFRLVGAAQGDLSGASVSNAGDINGDGFDDLIVGAYGADPKGDFSGSSFVVFGKDDGFDASFNLSTLDGNNGFRLNGVARDDRSGASVNRAGDINGDGYDDLVVDATRADSNALNAGASYVVFGQAEGFAASVDLASLNGSNGFRLNGLSSGDGVGWNSSGAGDINGDGIDDLVIGASRADSNGSNAGAVYVVFGRTTAFSANFNLSTLNGNNGFRLIGQKTEDFAGVSVSGAGDVNGDGFDDLIIGANGADPNGSNSGASYVVFGKADGFTSTFNLSSVNGNNGFRLNGQFGGDESGSSVNGAGDINGDGFDDLIVGVPRADFNGINSGSSYVVFGRSEGFSPSIDLATLDGNSGFRLDGQAQNVALGGSVSGAGDVNGDGFDDIFVGASTAANGGDSSGSGYMIYGKAVGFGAVLNIALMTRAESLRFDGVNAGDRLGLSVSGAGDLNSDGFDDLIIGASGADSNGLDSGSSYVIFGSASTIDINNSAPTGEVLITGEAIETEILSVNNTLVDADTLGEIFYQWKVDGVPILKATTDSLLLIEDFNSKSISVTASYVDGRGSSESITSGQTTQVKPLIVGTEGDDILIGGAGDEVFRSFAGNDTLTGGDGSDQMNGGTGLDQAQFERDIADYSILIDESQIIVTDSINDAQDQLTEIERLHFNDLSLAFDLDGNAGQVAKLMGAMLGADAWNNPEFVGIGLDILDKELLEFDALIENALEVRLGSNPSNEDVVNLLYTNLVGDAPSAIDLDFFVASIDDGTFTQTSITAAAIDHPLNSENIDLVGLAQSGIEYDFIV